MQDCNGDARSKFIKICETNIHRDGIDDLMCWLDKSDFFTAPASTRFHGNYQGGLVEHSLHVYNQVNRLLDAYKDVLDTPSEETIAIISLFHDLCKVNMYATEKRNRKNEDGKWESYDAYTRAEKFNFGGHGSKSVFITQNFMRLTPEEAVSINCHMGSWDGNTSVGDAYEQYPLAWILHISDEAATYIDELKSKTV